jgi:hypothetical protein
MSTTSPVAVAPERLFELARRAREVRGQQVGFLADDPRFVVGRGNAFEQVRGAQQFESRGLVVRREAGAGRLLTRAVEARLLALFKGGHANLGAPPAVPKGAGSPLSGPRPDTQASFLAGTEDGNGQA